MAQTIKLRRSSSSGSIPTTSQLELGEVAINTYDGKMYIKKNVGGTESVIEVGASAAPVPGGSDGQIQFNNSGTMDGASFLYADDTNSRLGIGTTSPSTQLEVNGTITTTGLIAGTNEFPTTQGELGEVLTADGSGLVEWKLPQTLSYLVYNADSTTIAAGEPVYVFGANGTNISVKRALNTSDATCAQTLGLANESIASGSTGVIIGQGLLRGIDTTGYTAGQALYLGSTAGSITTTKPYAPNHLVYLGFVQTSASNGRIFVRTQNGYELDEIHDVQITSTPSDGDVLAYDSATSLWKPTADYAQLGEAQTWTANQTFDDNAKAIFGAGSDLQIYHDGSNSYVDEQGTGYLIIRASAYTAIRGTDNNNLFLGTSGAGAQLYYTGNSKLATTSTGISITGTVVADGLTVDTNTLYVDATNNRVGIGTTTPANLAHVKASTNAGGITIQRNSTTAGDYGQLSFVNSTTDSFAPAIWIRGYRGSTVNLDYMTFGSLGLERMRIADNGDISFYEDTGTTAKFFWDASAESLGIGTTNPSSVLHLSTSNDPKITLTDTGFGASADITGSNGNLRLNSQTATIFDMADSEVARIDSSGNLLVGATSSIGYKFEVTATTDVAQFIANSAGASGAQIQLFHDSASPANDDVTSLINFAGRDSAAQSTIYSRISGISTNVTNGSESGAIAFSTRNLGTFAERLRIDSSGNVGIGTSSPSGLFSLAKGSRTLDIKLEDTAATGDVGVQLRAGSGDFLGFAAGGGTGIGIVLDSSNNVGIGTSSPSQPLHVYHATTNGVATFQSGDANVNISLMDNTTTAANYVGIGAIGNNLTLISGNGGEKVRIDSSGNVGIGTTSIQGILDTEWSTNSAAGGIYFRNNNSGSSAFAGIYFGNDVSNTDAFIGLNSSTNTQYAGTRGLLIGTNASSGIAFMTGGTQKAVIDSSGNVGIGTTSPNGKLDIKLAPTPSSTTVNETADFADKFVIGTNASGNFGDKIPLVFNVGNSTGDHISTAIVGEREASGWTSALSFWTNNQTSGTEGTDAIQEKMRITGAGYVGIGTTSPSQELHVVGTGYASTDFRAPIFYDSDNTAYYVNPASRSYLNGVSSVGLSTSWGTTSGVNTGALNAIMGTSTSATWLLSGTSGGTFRYGIQGLDSGGALRLYVGSNYLAFDGSTLSGTNLSGNATTATTLQTARTINGVSFNGSANINIGRLYSESGTTTNYLALSSTNELELFNSSGSVIDLYLNYSGGATSLKGPSGSTIWTSGNDGSGSGLDADLLDGQHGSYYTGYTDTAIANLIDTAPSTLDTLNELAAALGDDANFSTTVTNSIATKISKTGDTATGTHTFDDLRADGGNLILGDDAYSVSASYIGMKTSYQSGANDYMIISGTTDGNTYISAKDGSSVFIRGGGNYNNNQIEVPDTGAPTIAGSTIWHAGNDGTGSGLDADLLDGQEGSYYTNASNISSGTLSNSRLEDIFKAGTEIPTAANLNDYRTTGYYSQNANADAAAGSNYPVALAGILEVINDDTGNGAHTVQRYTRYNSPYTTYHRYYYNGSWGSWSTNWDSTNDGSGSGLDADLLDGQHGSYYYAASNPSGYTTNTGTVTSVAAGSYLTGGTITTTGTLAVDATSANTASKVVARDASGNFSAGTITAALSGNATTSSSTTGNAATATTLQTARTINGVSFNGSANIVVESYIEDDEATAATRYITFVDNTTAAYKRLNEDSSLTYNPSTNTVTAGTFSGALSGNATTATNVSGYSGTYWTSNNDGSGSGLDADLLDGQEGSYYAAASSLGSYLPLTGGTLTGALTGTTITTSGDINVGGGHVSTSTVQARVKFSVWSSTTYGIGMTSGISYGGIGAGTTEYALTNQMSDTAARGFWWGDSGHTNAQGAMALTTNGLLTVASGMRLGYGESDGIAPTSGQLSVNGTINATTSISAPIFYDSANTTYYVDPASTVYSAVLAGNVSIGGISKTSDTTVAVSAGDSNSAGFVAHGNAQGTAYFEWSQNSTRTYGGGIVYNGDGVPSFGAGEVTDRTTFYRIISGSKYKVFDYPYDNSIVTFYDEISVTNTCIAKNFDEGINSTTGVSGTSSLSPSGGSIREISLSGNVTFTSGFEYGESMTLMLTGGATYTVTWPTMTWLTPNGNVAPTLNGTKDLIIIWRGAYGNLYGAYAGYGA